MNTTTNMQHFKNTKKFELTETMCFGVQKKWGKINIPLCLENEQVKKELVDLAEKNNCKNPMHGDILYLKCEGLSPQQKVTLLEQGRCFVNVAFECIGVYEKTETDRYLVLKVRKLSRDVKEVEIEIPEDF